jgi:hypothetical protein
MQSSAGDPSKVVLIADNAKFEGDGDEVHLEINPNVESMPSTKVADLKAEMVHRKYAEPPCCRKIWTRARVRLTSRSAICGSCSPSRSFLASAFH